jgi:hypothetical protein
MIEVYAQLPLGRWNDQEVALRHEDLNVYGLVSAWTPCYRPAP